MSPDASSDESRPQRRKWKRWVFGGLLLLVVGGLLWLNGPGIRWLAPKVAESFLEKSGLKGSFEVEGSLTGWLEGEGPEA